MKTKELIKRLQSLGQELDVYIWNEKERSLFSVENINETSDFGENEKGEAEWEDFVTIFPTTKSQPLFTLTEEEAILLRYALSDAIYYCDEYSKDEDSAKYSEKYTKMFDKVSEWLYDNEI